jgi:DedD protein
MDTALKQRLLGAVVLIALAIIFVPMFLSGSPPKSETTSQEIPTPPERKFETRVLPVDTTSRPPTSAAPSPDHVATVDTHAPAKVDAMTDGGTGKPTPSPDAAVKPAAAPSKPVNPDKPPPATAPVTTSTAPPLAAAASSGRFFVHLGIYADKEHSDTLVQSVKKSGFPAYVEDADFQGKPAQRVRMGPFADRVSAEAARLKFKQAEPKVPSSVIESTDQPKTDTAAAAQPANRPGGWAVQVGAFKSEPEAMKLRDRCRNAGYSAFVDHQGSGEGSLWRVRVGPEVERANAERLRAALKQKLRIDGLLVTQP